MSFGRPSHARPEDQRTPAQGGRIETLSALSSSLLKLYGLSGTITPGQAPRTPVLRVQSSTGSVDVGADFEESKGGWFYTWAFTGDILGLPSNQELAARSIAHSLGVAVWL